MNKKPSVYLCGPITGMTYENARYGWRNHVYERLSLVGIECLSPMRAKEALRDQMHLAAMGYEGSPLSSPKSIVARDRLDTTRSTMVFCNVIGADRPSIGSAIEFGWADAFRVPILLCIEADGSNVHEHAMIKEMASFVVHSVDDGIDVATAVLLPGV